MAADKLTIRADGEVVCEVYLSAKEIALHRDETWTPAETKQVRRPVTPFRGEYYTQPMTLEARLRELLSEDSSCGTSQFERAWEACRNASTVTICDEYLY